MNATKLLDVLLVDDSMTVIAVLEKTLRIAGLPIGQVYRAGNGEEALQVLQQNPVDLVITDIVMPVMNGIEMIDNIRSSSSLAHIPIIVITSDGSHKRMEELHKRQIAGYLRKPFTAEEVDNLIEEVLVS